MILPVKEHWTGFLGLKAGMRLGPLSQARRVSNLAGDSDLGNGWEFAG